MKELGKPEAMDTSGAAVAPRETAAPTSTTAAAATTTTTAAATLAAAITARTLTSNPAGQT